MINQIIGIDEVEDDDDIPQDVLDELFPGTEKAEPIKPKYGSVIPYIAIGERESAAYAVGDQFSEQAKQATSSASLDQTLCNQMNQRSDEEDIYVDEDQ